MASSNVNEWAILGNRIKATTIGIGDAVLEMSGGVAKFLNEISKTSSLSSNLYAKERRELKDLILVLRDTSTPLEERKRIINELQQKYPSYLGNIKNEGTLTDELKNGLVGVNEQLLQRIKIDANKDKIAEKAEDRDAKEKARNNAKLALLREIEDVRKGNATLREFGDFNGSVLDQFNELEDYFGKDSPQLRLVNNLRQRLIDSNSEYI